MTLMNVAETLAYQKAMGERPARRSRPHSWDHNLSVARGGDTVTIADVDGRYWVLTLSTRTIIADRGQELPDDCSLGWALWRKVSPMVTV